MHEIDENLFQDLLDKVPEEPPLCEAGMAAGAGVNDGLLHGPTGLADVGKRGIKRRGGLLMQVFGKVQKTNEFWLVTAPGLDDVWPLALMMTGDGPWP